MHYIDLGINSALSANRIYWEKSTPGHPAQGPGLHTENRAMPAATRQPLPPWNERLSKPVGEPLPVWRDEWGLWGRGRRIWSYSSHRTRGCPPWRCWGQGCAHLTLASNCHIDFSDPTTPNGDFIFHIDGEIHEYAIRPYWWTETAVQDAYEIVSEGDVTAAEIDSLKYVGRTYWNETDEIWEYRHTSAQETRVLSIHTAWDNLVLDRLAFFREKDGKELFRPFRSPPGDEDMADEAPNGYGYPNHLVRRGLARTPKAFWQPKPLPKEERGLKGERYRIQSVTGWQEETGGDGALEEGDWDQVARTILNDVHWDYQGTVNNVDGHITPETGPILGEAFDLCVFKREVHPHPKWREQFGMKGGLVELDISCRVVSGSPSSGPAKVIVNPISSAAALGLFSCTQHNPQPDPWW